MATPAFPSSYTPVFADSEQPPAQRWHWVGSPLSVIGDCYAVPRLDIMVLHLRYIAGELDTTQLLDETKRRLH